jgi:hypothetical protein
MQRRRRPKVCSNLHAVARGGAKEVHSHFLSSFGGRLHLRHELRFSMDTCSVTFSKQHMFHKHLSFRFACMSDIENCHLYVSSFLLLLLLLLYYITYVLSSFSLQYFPPFASFFFSPLCLLRKEDERTNERTDERLLLKLRITTRLPPFLARKRKRGGREKRLQR